MPGAYKPLTIEFGSRTLPIGLSPLSGESLESWLATMTNQLGVRWCDMLAQALPDELSDRKGRWRYLSTYLRPRQISTIAAATGVNRATIEGLTLAGRYGRQLMVDLHPDNRYSYVSTNRSRYCPKCLRETGGRWQLQWRLPWVFACMRHSCLLSDTCPQCDQYQLLNPRWFLPSNVPIPRRCAMPAVPRNLTQRCGADLAAAASRQLALDGGLVAASKEFADAAEVGRAIWGSGIYRGDPVAPGVFFRDLRMLVTRILTLVDINIIGELVGPEPELKAGIEALHFLRRRGAKYTGTHLKRIPAVVSGIAHTAALRLNSGEPAAWAALSNRHAHQADWQAYISQGIGMSIPLHSAYREAF
jgi:hypothetical protein